MEYALKVSQINYENLPQTVADRTPALVKQLLDGGNYVIDVHTHLFDIKCINKAYFILRMLKDLVGLKSATNEVVEFSVEQAYQESDENAPNWEDELMAELSVGGTEFTDKTQQTKGVIDIFHARKFLGMKTMEDVYWHYLNNFSLANCFDHVPQDNVIITALMMDLEIGWDVRLKKNLYHQIIELKELSEKFPVLPFLFCDPRRATDLNPEKNLYALFNTAFCEGKPFFGVKIYPALGYDPSDYRLWPIYEICEKLSIPIVSHHGGETVSTDNRSIVVYEGKTKTTITGANREEIAYQLNDPARWTSVLKMFPNLKLNFGHFGGYETWASSSPVSIEEDAQQRKEVIFQFMRNYPNVYADFSFNLIELKLYKNLKNVIVNDPDIRSRTLFGSDFWVVNPKGNLNNLQQEFVREMERNTQSMKIAHALCVENPKKFLFG